MMIHSIVVAEAAHNPLVPALPDLVWSSVVFAVLLVFFWTKVLPNFKKNLDARTAAIEGRLEAAEKAQSEAAAKTANIEAEQQAARTEASQIREEARAQGAAILAELKEQVRPRPSASPLPQRLRLSPSARQHSYRCARKLAALPLTSLRAL